MAGLTTSSSVIACPVCRGGFSTAVSACSAPSSGSPHIFQLLDLLPILSALTLHSCTRLVNWLAGHTHVSLFLHRKSCLMLSLTPDQC